MHALMRRISAVSQCTALAAVLLATVLVYASQLNAEFVRWDDDLLVTENPVVASLTPVSVARAFSMYDPELYIPLTFVSYQIDAAIGGIKPFPFHRTNLLLHLLNTFFVVLIVALLSRGRLAVGILAGALFALHPINTEAVLWVSARKDLLSALFLLVATLLYLAYREDERRLLYGLSIAAFALSLLAKVSTLTLPVVLLLLDWYRDGGISRRRLTEKVPYVALSVVFGIVALFGKSGAIAHGSFVETIVMAGRSAAFYLQKLTMPFGLSVIYPHDGPVTLFDMRFAISWIVVATLLAVAWVSRNRMRAVTTAILFFLITLAPTFLNARKGDGFTWFIASDRYAYVPAIAVFVLAAAGLFALLRDRRIAMTAGSILTIIFAFLAHTQAAVWKDSETLFLNVLEHYPRSQIAYNNLGTVYHRRGDIENAERAYRASLEIRPQAKTWSNLGSVLRERGKTQEAFAAFQSALAINPDESAAHFALGIAYAQTGDVDNARTSYLRAAELKPGDARPWLNLGALAMQSGDASDAVGYYDEALRRNPYYLNAHFNRAVALTRLGRVAEARAAYERALEIDSSFEPARKNLEQLR